MKLFVTGANGFIGSATVESALDHGHHVVALVRGSSDRSRLGWADHPNVDIVSGDVRSPSSWAAALDGVDVVLHLAAVFGDFFDQFAVTVVGTERLLAAMNAAGVGRMVLVSTFSNYDYRASASGGVLDESTPLEATPDQRDGYTQTKLFQERITREFCEANSIDLTVIRPGAVYGPGKLWLAGLANIVGPVGIAVAPNGQMKLTYVRNCADAIVLSAEVDAAIGQTFNIVDDDLPTQREYLAAMKRHGFDVPTVNIPVPYVALSAAATALDLVNQRWFSGKAKLPQLAVPAKLAASFRPHSYSNERAHRVLGWTPARTLDQALTEIKRAETDSPVGR